MYGARWRPVSQEETSSLGSGGSDMVGLQPGLPHRREEEDRHGWDWEVRGVDLSWRQEKVFRVSGMSPSMVQEKVIPEQDDKA